MERLSPSLFSHLKPILSLPFVVNIIVPTLIIFSFEKMAFQFFGSINNVVISFIGGFIFDIECSLFYKK